MSTVVFDLDDTLCDFIPLALQQVEKISGQRLDPYQLTRHWAEEIKDEHRQACIDAVFNREFYLNLKLWEQERTLKAIKALRRWHKVCVITARSSALKDEAFSVTEEWLRKVHLDVDDLKVCKLSESKLTLFPPDTLAVVEDSVYVAEEAADKDLKVFMRTQPWNLRWRHRNAYIHRYWTAVSFCHRMYQLEFVV